MTIPDDTNALKSTEANTTTPKYQYDTNYLKWFTTDDKTIIEDNTQPYPWFNPWIQTPQPLLTPQRELNVRKAALELLLAVAEEHERDTDSVIGKAMIAMQDVLNT